MSETKKSWIPPKFMKVSGGTDCHKLASCMAEATRHYYPQESYLTVEFVGAGPCAQAFKAVIIANSMLSQQSLGLSIVPSFKNKEHETLENFVVMRFKLVISELK